jgi:hypothetical protein
MVIGAGPDKFLISEQNFEAANFNGAILIEFRASLITRFSARWLLWLGPRPAGQPMAVFSDALRLLAFIGMYACLASWSLLLVHRYMDVTN